MHSLNPYELLGVTTNSTCQEVRKRYYALACLCHPDRGGSNDQMQILHNAYEYVMKQVALNTTKSYEDLEADFQDFCAAQTSTPPPFVDIHAEAFNLPKFNELFELHTPEVLDGAFDDGGYATCPSEVKLEYAPYDPRVERANVVPFSTDVVIYEEPEPVVMPRALYRDLSQGADGCAPPAQMDYSCVVGTTYASDYKAALSPPVPLPEVPYPEDSEVLANFHRESARYTTLST